ncbi:hypothetical protein PMY12_15590 [Clostridium tertium]|uniref:hypothetical protein n=1 Tax=Clostridium tertium TaxID=1559 RepID=UPI00232C65B0|nr:hypothetical protein [Clostridium tertium]MBS6504408.1 hypothetical protein [Clostridium sp.]MDB1935115.1 hypothetical protein [Clostridium tertium]MDB1938430.1 hypothetical protein [Clostridium tertium]
MDINKDTMELSYEVGKLQAKIRLCSDIVRSIDNKLLDLRLHENDDLDDISEKISDIRDNLRDLEDFMNN